MAHAAHGEYGNFGPNAHGHPVRTLSLAEYRTTHPTTPMFPPTSETAVKVVMILLYALIVIGIVYIALRSTGVV